MNIDIRRATGSDLLELLTLEQAVFPPNLYHLINKRQYKYLLQKANAEIWLASHDQEICAASIVLYRKNTCYGRLYSLAVFPQYQGQGIGSMLLQHAEKRIRQHGLTQLRQELRENRKNLINHYQKIGFVPYGRTAHYYPDGVACLRLKKDIHYD